MLKINGLLEVVLEPFDLMHPLVQDGDYADVAVGKAFPVHEMALVAKEVPRARGAGLRYSAKNAGNERSASPPGG